MVHFPAVCRSSIVSGFQAFWSSRPMHSHARLVLINKKSVLMLSPCTQKEMGYEDKRGERGRQEKETQHRKRKGSRWGELRQPSKDCSLPLVSQTSARIRAEASLVALSSRKREIQTGGTGGVCLEAILDRTSVIPWPLIYRWARTLPRMLEGLPFLFIFINFYKVPSSFDVWINPSVMTFQQ